MTSRCFAVLLCCLLSGPAIYAMHGPKLAIVSASPDSALVHLRAAQVYAQPMLRLGGRRRWRYRPGAPLGWASPATNDRDWLLASPGFLVGEEPPD